MQEEGLIFGSVLIRAGSPYSALRVETVWEEALATCKLRGREWCSVVFKDMASKNGTQGLPRLSPSESATESVCSLPSLIIFYFSTWQELS